MTTLKEIRVQLDGVAHASQNKAVLGALIDYLREAGVRTPAEKEAEMNEERHRQVAEAQTIEELDAAVEGWGADFQPDGDLERAVDQRDAYLREQEQAEQQASQTGADYSEWSKTKLQAEARKRNLAVSGSKEELAARLAEADEVANQQQ